MPIVVASSGFSQWQTQREPIWIVGHKNRVFKDPRHYFLMILLLCKVLILVLFMFHSCNEAIRGTVTPRPTFKGNAHWWIC